MVTKAALDVHFHNERLKADVEAAALKREERLIALLEVMNLRLQRTVQLLERADDRARGILSDDD